VDEDAVDQQIKLWTEAFPDLDRSVEGVVSRIQKLSRYLDKSFGETAAEFELTLGELDVLKHLRLKEHPHELSPGKLSEKLMLSSGAMTNRLDKLEAAELVERAPDPNDRRGVIVRLTEEGAKRFAQAIERQIEKEKNLVDVLGVEDREDLAAQLRKLMLWFEELLGPPVHTGEMEAINERS
jgi:DNA-binding MarR family transcriptional regulator